MYVKNVEEGQNTSQPRDNCTLVKTFYCPNASITHLHTCSDFMKL